MIPAVGAAQLPYRQGVNHYQAATIAVGQHTNPKSHGPTTFGVQPLLSEPEFDGAISKIAVLADCFIRRYIARAVQMVHAVMMHFI